MSTGQIFLALGAIALFSLTAVNVNRTYVTAIEEAVTLQAEVDAIQYGQSLADEVAANRADYADLGVIYANLGNVNQVATRRQFVTPVGDTLYSTITVAAEAPLLHDIPGKTVTITVFTREEATYRLRARYIVPVVQPE